MIVFNVSFKKKEKSSVCGKTKEPKEVKKEDKIKVLLCVYCVSFSRVRLGLFGSIRVRVQVMAHKITFGEV